MKKIFTLYVKHFGLFIYCLFLLSACKDVESTESVKFKVISYGGNFTGSCSVDSRRNRSFMGHSMGNDGFYYEENIEIENQLEVEADAINDDDGENNLTSLQIKIYVADKLVKSSEDTSEVEKISVTYTVGENSDY